MGTRAILFAKPPKRIADDKGLQGLPQEMTAAAGLSPMVQHWGHLSKPCGFIIVPVHRQCFGAIVQKLDDQDLAFLCGLGFLRIIHSVFYRKFREMILSHQGDHKMSANRADKASVLFGIVRRIFVFRDFPTNGALLGKHDRLPFSFVFWACRTSSTTLATGDAAHLND
jgi:hypothetical protein